MYRYETHLHTSPVSKCASSSVSEQLDLYKSLDYDGVFITNHFLDGNINISSQLPYEERINFYFADYEAGAEYGKKIGLKVFCGLELSYCGTDFLIYGLDKAWCLANPQIMEMRKSEELKYMIDSGALVIQAHPYREASYIDHIRLFPRQVHGVEIVNASRTEEENSIAKIYADHYGLLYFAGSDNHSSANKKFAGMESATPINSVDDFINAIKNKEMKPFSLNL